MMKEEKVYVKVVRDAYPGTYCYYIRQEVFNAYCVGDRNFAPIQLADLVMSSSNRIIKSRLDIDELVENGIGKVISEDEALGIPSKEEILSWIHGYDIILRPDILNDLAKDIHSKLKERMRNES